MRRLCAHCEQPFEAADVGNGKHAKWCSDYCRKRDHRLRTASTCIDCGEKTASPRAKRCHACEAIYKEWSPEEIIEAIQRYHARYGELPSSVGWGTFRLKSTTISEKSRAKHQQRWDEDKWPSAMAIVRHFGRFNEAIEAAGFEPRPSRNRKVAA